MNLYSRIITLCLLSTNLLFLSFIQLALAQISPSEIPGNIQPPQEIPPLPQTLPSPSLPPLKTPPSVLPQPSSIPESTVKVERIEVLGSTVFSEQELAKITAPYINKELSFEQLQELKTALNNLYTSNGFITSGTFLPLQDSSSGVVQIQVVEGELERIDIQGLRRLRKGYVRSRIRLAAKTPLNIRRLEEALQLLQLDPLFSQVRAELQSGTAIGRNVLVLNLKEAPQLSSNLVFENRESPSVGEIGGTATLSHNNLLGFGDRLSATVEKTEGVLAYGFSYDVPVNARGGTVSLRYNQDENRVIEELYEGLDINGQTETFSLGFRQPLIRTPTNEFSLNLAADLRRSQTFLFGDLPFSFVEGPEKGRSNVTVLRFGQDWLNRSSSRVLAARSQFSFGLNAFDATVNNSGTDGRFFSWLGQFQWVQALNNRRDIILVARAAAQLTPDSLLPLEQFGVGGIDTVRGYRQNQLVTDNGVLGSLEVRLPIASNPGVLQLRPFFDIGTAWSNRGANPDPSVIASLGLGLSWAITPDFDIRLDYGVPLVSVDNRGSSLQDSGFNFSIRYQPF